MPLCPICHSHEVEYLHSELDYDGMTYEKIEHYYRCRYCGTEFVITEEITRTIEVLS